MHSVEDLDVFKLAHDLALKIYSFTTSTKHDHVSRTRRSRLLRPVPNVQEQIRMEIFWISGEPHTLTSLAALGLFAFGAIRCWGFGDMRPTFSCCRLEDDSHRARKTLATRRSMLKE